MKDLYIIGAGGLGREVLSYARDMENRQSYWRIKGFLNSQAYMDALDGIDTGEYKICESIEEHKVSDKNVYIFAIADVDAKKSILNSFIEQNAEFINLIHYTAHAGYTAKLGKGIIMGAYASVSENVIIGDFVTINAYSSVGHDAIINDYCTISSHCDITGHTKLNTGVFLGSSAIITPGVEVGENARVGAGSVVLKNVKPNTTVFGNPAKIIF